MEASFFTNNRKRLLESLQPGSVVNLAANGLMQLTADMAAPFRQEANFWYLTGINAPNWQLLMTDKKSWLIAPHQSQSSQLFDGGLPAEEAQTISGVDEVLTANRAAGLIKDVTGDAGVVYALGEDPHAKHYDFTLNPGPLQPWAQLSGRTLGPGDVRPLLERLRAVKQPVEVEMIRQAVKQTIDAFRVAHERMTSYRFEYEIESEFTAGFRKHGMQHAYDPIIAAGGNACTLHYADNSARLTKGQLVLMDVGAYHSGYAADITRTFAFGEIAQQQQQIHGAVEQAHKSIIGLIKPGLLISDYHKQVDYIMKRSLAALGLMKSDQDYRRYFPHAISHGLGIDVHESLGGMETFKTGMVLTVEPGIYITEEQVGVRLEDNILVTDDGNENLSQNLSLGL